VLADVNTQVGEPFDHTPAKVPKTQDPLAMFRSAPGSTTGGATSAMGVMGFDAQFQELRIYESTPSPAAGFDIIS
jgi:hypothetical protein